MSDEGGKLATPMEVMEVDSSIVESIRRIIRTEDVKRVVLGLPLNMDGSIGDAAKEVVAWAKGLGDVQVVFVDERLSSFDAEQSLVDRKRGGEKMTRKRKKNLLDAVVAAKLLQQFLDGKLVGIEMD